MSVLRPAVILSLFAAAALCQPQSSLLVEGIGGSSVTLSVADIAKLPPKTVTAADHGTEVTFAGALLSDVLGKVTLPLGEKFHSTGASYYLLVEARDGYKTVFAWAELDPSFMEKPIYLVTQRNGKPLSERDGPFQLVVPGEKRNGRSTRQITALRVKQAN